MKANNSELTINQTTDFLNVSRPYVIKLLEEGKIPYRKMGDHRMLKSSAVASYKKQQQKESERALKELAREAQELNLGY